MTIETGNAIVWLIYLSVSAFCLAGAATYFATRAIMLLNNMRLENQLFRAQTNKRFGRVATKLWPDNERARQARERTAMETWDTPTAKRNLAGEPWEAKA